MNLEYTDKQGRKLFIDLIDTNHEYFILAASYEDKFLSKDDLERLLEDEEHLIYKEYCDQLKYDSDFDYYADLSRKGL